MKPARFFIATILIFTLILSATCTAFAGCWVKIKADVPEGFRGDVTAELRNEKGGKYEITCHYVGDYVNSALIPEGEYTVKQVYTSAPEELFAGESLTDTFTAKEGAILETKVIYLYADYKKEDAAPGSNEPAVDTTSNEDVLEEISDTKQDNLKTSSGTQNTKNNIMPLVAITAAVVLAGIVAIIILLNKQNK